MPRLEPAQRELSGLALLAHAMGIAARRKGENALSNPFQDEPGTSSAWLDGWMAAGVPI